MKDNRIMQLFMTFLKIGVVLPSFVVIIMVAGIFDRFQKSKIVNGAMLGLRKKVNPILLIVISAVVGIVIKC